MRSWFSSSEATNSIIHDQTEIKSYHRTIKPKIKRHPCPTNLQRTWWVPFPEAADGRYCWLLALQIQNERPLKARPSRKYVQRRPGYPQMRKQKLPHKFSDITAECCQMHPLGSRNWKVHYQWSRKRFLDSSAYRCVRHGSL
jgi:hypothetical protein